VRNRRQNSFCCPFLVRGTTQLPGDTTINTTFDPTAATQLTHLLDRILHEHSVFGLRIRFRCTSSDGHIGEVQEFDESRDLASQMPPDSFVRIVLINFPGLVGNEPIVTIESFLDASSVPSLDFQQVRLRRAFSYTLAARGSIPSIVDTEVFNSNEDDYVACACTLIAQEFVGGEAEEVPHLTDAGFRYQPGQRVPKQPSAAPTGPFVTLLKLIDGAVGAISNRWARKRQ
jgi:hypothetical protein